MKKIAALVSTAALAFAGAAKPMMDTELKINADQILADNKSGTLVATGNVHAVCKPFCLLSDLVEKQGYEYRLASPSTVTTCTNDVCSLHWQATGELEYYGEYGKRYISARNVVVSFFKVPVLWVPYYRYDLDEHYGLRFMPGYTSRWGAYLLTKYVYTVAGGFKPGAYGLAGATYFDLRAENGVAIGQDLYWQLGDYGRGEFKVYYAWDLDYERYSSSWTNNRYYNYQNWGSEVERGRYAVQLSHKWNMTERDTLRLMGVIFSDTHFQGDFLREKSIFGSNDRFVGYTGNEIAWEHLENSFGLGVSVAGPLNDFYGGVARLPEVHLNVAPQPVASTPVNYESESLLGFLTRQYSKFGKGGAETMIPYRYMPGEWAEYQTFRFDTYHRLTAPFKVKDAVAVAPRVGGRATFWNQTGYDNLTGYGKSGRAGDAWRTIAEGGVTFAARGVADFGESESWQHVLEPYADVLAQQAFFSGLKDNSRPYIFDSVDGSSEWLDQFAGRSRNLPYTWYGVTPGLRNVFRKAGEDGAMRTVFDFDVYAAVQLNRTKWTGKDRNHKLADDPADPNYGRDYGIVVPGARARLYATDDTALMARMEIDTENRKIAYAGLSWMHRLSEKFKYSVSYSERDHRKWDFSSSPYDPRVMEYDGFSWARISYLELNAEQEIFDWLAWGPFIRWDFRESELDEVGGWVDLRTDCLGFRFIMSYENSLTRIDTYEREDDWRFGFFIYLRALGADATSVFY